MGSSCNGFREYEATQQELCRILKNIRFYIKALTIQRMLEEPIFQGSGFLQGEFLNGS